MSDILSALKDAVNPKRREEATTPGTYNPHTRGPYPDQPSEGVRSSEHQVEPPKTTVSESTSNERGLSSNTSPAADELGTGSVKYGTDKGFHAPKGTFGPHGSRIANALDPRVDSDRDGRPKHGVSQVGGVAGRDVGGK